jgi:hypothetical protein
MKFYQRVSKDWYRVARVWSDEFLVSYLEEIRMPPRVLCRLNPIDVFYRGYWRRQLRCNRRGMGLRLRVTR